MAGATKNSSHITTLKSHHGHHVLKEFIAGAYESSKLYRHIFSIRIKKSLRARSPYASRLHWGAGFDRLVVYASIISIYIGALTDYVPRAPNKATETRLILLNLQGPSSPAVLMPTLLCHCCPAYFQCFYWLSDRFPAYVQCFYWLCHCCPAFFQCSYWLSHCFPTSFQYFH